ncbi:ParA family protein [Acidobacteriota bacterium]
MSIIALYHFKGGVGKTAAAVNLSYLAAQEGHPTLLIDLDPQGSASYYFKIRPSKKQRAKQLIKGKKTIEDNLKGTDYDGLDALPSHMSYRNLDIALGGLKRSKRFLKDLLVPIQREYRYVFLDSPPNITLVSENIFNAANILLIPVIPTTLSVLAYEKLWGFFGDKNLDRSKIVAFYSMAERRKKMHREILGKRHPKERRFLKPVIPYSVVVEKMGIHREPVALFAPDSNAALAYANLWQELKKLMARR